MAANAICCVSENTNNPQFHMAINPAAPFVINVIPAVASVGEIPKSADNVLIYMYKFHTDRRAIIDSQTWGFVKMWTTSDEPKRFLAVQLAHEAAAEIIEYYSMIISLSKLYEICDNESIFLIFIKIFQYATCVFSHSHIRLIPKV